MNPCPKPEGQTPQRKWREKARLVCSKIAVMSGKCERCGRTAPKFVLHAAHIVPSRFGATDCDIDIRVCLCGFCHTADNDSAHLNERDFHAWFDYKNPGKREALMVKARQVFTGDFSDIYVELLNTYKSKLEEKERM